MAAKKPRAPAKAADAEQTETAAAPADGETATTPPEAPPAPVAETATASPPPETAANPPPAVRGSAGFVTATLKSRYCDGGRCKEAGEQMRMTRGTYERLKKYGRME